MLTRLRGEQIHHTISVRHITPTVFILRITRRELQFKPGQHLTLGIPGVGELREYSIYSPPHHHYLEVLVRLVETGRLTPKLAKLRPGDEVLVDGPNGFFTLTDEQILHPQLFIATGTGIAPFHCFAASHKNLDYTIVHGVACHTEQHDPGHYKPGCYIPCFSRERNLPFAGRVTDWLRQNQVAPQTEVMVCGNSQMILDVWEMLLDQQHPMEKVRQEIYFQAFSCWRWRWRWLLANSQIALGKPHPITPAPRHPLSPSPPLPLKSSNLQIFKSLNP